MRLLLCTFVAIQWSSVCQAIVVADGSQLNPQVTFEDNNSCAVLVEKVRIQLLSEVASCWNGTKALPEQWSIILMMIPLFALLYRLRSRFDNFSSTPCLYCHLRPEDNKCGVTLPSFDRSIPPSHSRIKEKASVQETGRELEEQNRTLVKPKEKTKDARNDKRKNKAFLNSIKEATERLETEFVEYQVQNDQRWESLESTRRKYQEKYAKQKAVLSALQKAIYTREGSKTTLVLTEAETEEVVAKYELKEAMETLGKNFQGKTASISAEEEKILRTCALTKIVRGKTNSVEEGKFDLEKAVETLDIKRKITVISVKTPDSERKSSPVPVEDDKIQTISCDLPRAPALVPQNILMLDLDCTLVYYDPKMLTNRASDCRKMKLLNGYLHLRPYLQTFLENTRKAGYTLGIVTASIREYATEVKSIIDPRNEFFHSELIFAREELQPVITSAGSVSYKKDLKKLLAPFVMCNQARISILDDNPDMVFPREWTYGIEAWKGSPYDIELQRWQHWFVRRLKFSEDSH
eukprot:TRINITY_DN4498_c0_g1_i1.p1 TRINITY_DN4498_c0_g1~~TRINITY_DN4498_c0_g1_i1.p1  ORF type:complete len:522 (+),score=93.72 TRINITY_DN4498_c0_g1_i1:125-1690(+)